MEAVPKLPLLCFELKTSPESTQFAPKLKQYISEAYREDADSYSNELHQLEGLRSAAVRPTIDAAGLSSLTRYLCQLRAMQSRFPMAKGQPAACTFAWRDLYANMSCSLADIRFEMASVLYNIGALHTQLGASEPRTSADSMKAACMHYQNAAWAFQHLREQYPQPPGVDVSTEIMRVLQEICFAQAQECILDKSIQDSKKPSVIGAVATQVLCFYRNSYSLLGPTATSDAVHEIVGMKLQNFWIRFVSFKIAYIGCLVALYQGMIAEEQQKMGERVAFYQLAVDRLTEARKFAKYIEPVQITQEALTFTNDVVEGKRKAAKNENEFIYHEEVPEKDLLSELKPVSLVKAVSINFNDPEVVGQDLFSRLVPMGAHEASSLYSEEKAKLLRHVSGLAEDKNMELTEFMSSLQLDQLDVIDSDQNIPQDIVDRCAAMNAKTDIIQNLVDSMNSLAEIISDVEHSLAEIKGLIQEETLKEKEYQKAMGPRPPSIVQTELSREYHKYQEAHTRTNESNQVLHKAMTLHIANLRLLAQPLDVLQTKIPSIDNIEGLDRDAMLEMRRVVGKAREMQTQRDSLIQQLRDAITNDDITAKLLAKAATDPIEDIFQQELDKFKPQVKIIKQNLSAQENIINKLTSLYASYGDSRRLLSEVLRKRDGLINALITSYDTYQELLGKSQKGLEFYKKLSHNVNQLLTRLKSTCQVQEEERQQMMNKQTSKASTPAHTVPMPSSSDSPPPPLATNSNPKLKDYLPYMKNRALQRNLPPQVPEAIPTDTYYPETIYPNTIRPPPLGSEATDMLQPNLPDGVVMPNAQNIASYNRYNTPYATSDANPYAVPSYNYPTTSSAQQDYEAKPPEDMSHYGYNSSYTPSHYTNQNMPGHQTYTNTYYSATPSNTQVTDSQVPMKYNPNMVQGMDPNQYHPYDQMYGAIQPPVSSTSSFTAENQAELNMNFAQMQVATPQLEQPPNVPPDYYYNQQYPQQNVNMPPYSAVPPNSFTNLPPTQNQDYNQPNSPYRQDTNQYNVQVPIVSNAYSTAQVLPNINNMTPNINAPYTGTSSNDGVSQGYAFYTNADNQSTTTPTFLQAPASMVQQTFDNTAVDPSLAYMDTFDKPIKSHAKGEALSSSMIPPTYPTYNQNQATTYPNPGEQNYQPAPADYQFADPNMSGSYAPTYQNHPGYAFNSSTGIYDYNYGSQNSYTTYGNPVNQVEMHPQPTDKNPNYPVQGMYTSAGGCETLQSPSEAPAMNQVVPEPGPNNQVYFNVPYGYQTTTNQSLEMPSNAVNTTNYGANVNQSTYMQSGKLQHTNVTFTNNQVASPKEEIAEPSYEQSNNPNITDDNVSNPVECPVEAEPQEIVEDIPDKEPEPSAFDLLSDIDFSVEHKPLMPEIKVPPISESVIKKSIVMPNSEQNVRAELREEILQRPPKKDMFSDPLLLNQFTQQVKKLQTLVDSLSNKTSSGLILLDSKWKSYEEIQAKENSSRSKLVAIRNTPGSIGTGAVPYDDSRVILKSDPDAYINASFYKVLNHVTAATSTLIGTIHRTASGPCDRENTLGINQNLQNVTENQLSPWCVPIVISSTPEKNNYNVFWRAVLDYKISCVVCLLSENEMQGKSFWPSTIGQVMDLDNGYSMTLEEVTSTVHWTERNLKITHGRNNYTVTHYQITAFPSKIICAPLLLLTQKIISATSIERGVWFHCASGGRSAIMATLCAVVCDVTAGNAAFCDLLEDILTTLYKHRTNVLEDTKYLADAYRTVLTYAQGVLCFGTTKYNGDAVSAHSTPPAAQSSISSQKPVKFSKESFEEMKHAPGLKSGDMKDPLNFLDPLWSLKKK